MCLRAIKTKHYMQCVPILSVLGYNIGSLVASGSTLLVLRQFPARTPAPTRYAFEGRQI